MIVLRVNIDCVESVWRVCEVSKKCGERMKSV